MRRSWRSFVAVREEIAPVWCWFFGGFLNGQRRWRGRRPYLRLAPLRSALLPRPQRGVELPWVVAQLLCRYLTPVEPVAVLGGVGLVSHGSGRSSPSFLRPARRIALRVTEAAGKKCR